MWVKWLLLICMAFECLGRIEQIGTMHVYTKNDAYITAIFNILLAIGILYYWR